MTIKEEIDQLIAKEQFVGLFASLFMLWHCQLEQIRYPQAPLHFVHGFMALTEVSSTLFMFSATCFDSTLALKEFDGPAFNWDFAFHLIRLHLSVC